MAKKLARKSTAKKAAKATKPVARKAPGGKRAAGKGQGKYVYFFGRKTDGDGSMKK